MPPQTFFFLGEKKFSVLDAVYEPHEDSFLLSSCIPTLSGKTFLDLGCGSGIQGLTAFLNGAGKVVFADKNPSALLNAKQNAQGCGMKNFELVQSDLFENITQKFDCISFNPPYIESDEIKFIEVDGGKKGRIVLDRFLSEVKNFLLPSGTVFFLQSNLNGVPKTKKTLAQNGFEYKIVAKQKLFFEELLVFRAWT